MGHMTHDEYVQSMRVRAVELAQQLLSSDDDFIVRVRELHGVLHEIDEPREEPFLRLTAVVSGTDHLPVSVAPELLDPDYQRRILKEAQDAAVFYRESVHEAAQAVVARYSDA